MYREKYTYVDDPVIFIHPDRISFMHTYALIQIYMYI